jgi:hypothetical protein
MLPRIFALSALIVSVACIAANEPAPKKTPKKALKEVSGLIGPWSGTGQPSGSLVDKQKGFWTEKMEWTWKFKEKDAWFTVEFGKGKYYSSGELRYDPDKDHFVLKLKTVNKDELTFTGNVEIKDKTKVLTLEREADKEVQRLVFTFLHDNYIRYRYEVKPEDKKLFSKKWDVGAKKDGIDFVGGDGRPECIVSGGLGTIAVKYMDKTYYVCCSGCRDEFYASPAKYVQAWEEKQKLKKK